MKQWQSFFIILSIFFGMLMPSFSFAKTTSPAADRYLPILMYHHITKRVPQNPYFVSPQIFDQQMAWLQQNKYQVISMDAAASALKNNTPLPEKSVVLTFDDGLRDQYENALPILKKYNDTATFYIITGSVGKKSYLTWDMIKKMHAAGMEIGAHTETHPNVAHLSGNKLTEEIAGSKIMLESELGIPVTSFAYPGGAYNDRAIAEVHAAGFTNAVSTRHRVMHSTTENPLALGRMHIDDDMISFALFVTGKKLN